MIRKYELILLYDVSSGKARHETTIRLKKRKVSFLGNIESASLILWLSSGVLIVQGICHVFCFHGGAYVIGVGRRMGQM